MSPIGVRSVRMAADWRGHGRERMPEASWDGGFASRRALLRCRREGEWRRMGERCAAIASVLDAAVVSIGAGAVQYLQCDGS